MTNLKTARDRRLGENGFGLFANMCAEVALPDRLEESSNFRFFARDLQFDPAVRQVTDPADDVEAFGYVLHRPAKTHALDAAFEKNLARIHDLLRTRYQKLKHCRNANREDDAPF